MYVSGFYGFHGLSTFSAVSMVFMLVPSFLADSMVVSTSASFTFVFFPWYIVVLLDAQWYCALPPAPRHPLLFFNRLPLLPTVLSFIFFIGIVSLGSSSLS